MSGSRVLPVLVCAASLFLVSPQGNASDRVPDPESFDGAITRWRTPAEVNAWIGASFRYDRERALQLSETQRSTVPTTDVIHAPAAFYARPTGICVDLARFGVEVLAAIAPATHPRYLMIEFEPVMIDGEVLRRHWLASYEVDGARYFFADSNRPGHIDGPHASVDAFIAGYTASRGRTIVAYRELATYRRRMKVQAVRHSMDE